MRRRQLVIAAGAALLIGCGTPAEQLAPAKLSPLGANRRLDVWPTAYLDAPRPVREAYAFASANYETLRYVPC
jgi:hypothetical protein